MMHQIVNPQSVTHCPDCGAPARNLMADYERNVIKCLLCRWWAWIHDPKEEACAAREAAEMTYFGEYRRA
jgi:hypothetical protein